MKTPETETLTLPDNPHRILQLRLKLKEYRKRLRKTNREVRQTLDDNEREGLQMRARITAMKLFILKNLLKKKTIVFEIVFQSILATLTETHDHKHPNVEELATYYTLAWEVIKDYARTGGENTLGGTGLPTVTIEEL